MTLRKFYIFMLCCSGLILMVHILVPHHHHTFAKQQSVLKHESSHNDDHHGHHHHKNANNEEPSSDTPLSHPLHQENIAKFVTKQTIVSIEAIKVMYLIPEYINAISPVPVKISSIYCKLDKGYLKSSYNPSCIALRGPPSMLFS